jgi:hypothetical protein
MGFSQRRYEPARPTGPVIEAAQDSQWVQVLAQQIEELRSEAADAWSLASTLKDEQAVRDLHCTAVALRADVAFLEDTLQAWRDGDPGRSVTPSAEAAQAAFASLRD